MSSEAELVIAKCSTSSAAGEPDFRQALRCGRHVDRRVKLSAVLSAEQQEKLAEICEKTPVTLVVKAGIPVATTLAASA